MRDALNPSVMACQGGSTSSPLTASRKDEGLLSTLLEDWDRDWVAFSGSYPKTWASFAGIIVLPSHYVSLGLASESRGLAGRLMRFLRTMDAGGRLSSTLIVFVEKTGSMKVHGNFC